MKGHSKLSTQDRRKRFFLFSLIFVFGAALGGAVTAIWQENHHAGADLKDRIRLDQAELTRYVDLAQKAYRTADVKTASWVLEEVLAKMKEPSLAGLDNKEMPEFYAFLLHARLAKLYLKQPDSDNAKKHLSDAVALGSKLFPHEPQTEADVFRKLEHLDKLPSRGPKKLND